MAKNSRKDVKAMATGMKPTYELAVTSEAQTTDTQHKTPPAKSETGDTSAPNTGGAEQLSGLHSTPASDPAHMQLSQRNVSSGSHPSNPSSSSHIQDARSTVAHAVLRMQGELQAELQEDEIHVFNVLGRGGFGTVYHGMRLLSLLGL
jgi:hypothetical protein